MFWNSHLIDGTIPEKYYICRRERSEDTDIPCFGHNCRGHDTHHSRRGVADILQAIHQFRSGGFHISLRISDQGRE